MQREAGAPLEPENEGLQREIVSPLRKAFGQFVNRELRFAVMLDEERTGDDGEWRAAGAGAQAGRTLRGGNRVCTRARSQRWRSCVACFVSRASQRRVALVSERRRNCLSRQHSLFDRIYPAAFHADGRTIMWITSPVGADAAQRMQMGAAGATGDFLPRRRFCPLTD